MRRLLFLSFVSLSLTSCAEPLETRPMAIYHGEAELGSKWAVAVSYLRPSNSRLRLCTGTLVTPEAVVTAKHCVFDETDEGPWATLAPDAFTVTVTHTMLDADAAEQVRGVQQMWSTPGNYERADALGGRDIAVLKLDAPIQGISPIPYDREPASQGDVVELVGFGFTQDDVLGVKHRAEASVKAVGEGIFETEGSSWTCTGDSGGPALRDGKLLGVTSIGTRGCSDAVSYFTRLDIHAAEIDAFLGIEPPEPMMEPDVMEPDVMEPTPGDPDMGMPAPPDMGTREPEQVIEVTDPQEMEGGCAVGGAQERVSLWWCLLGVVCLRRRTRSKE